MQPQLAANYSVEEKRLLAGYKRAASILRDSKLAEEVVVQAAAGLEAAAFSQVERRRKLMDRLMPNWRFYRQLLNRLPVRHEAWAY